MGVVSCRQSVDRRYVNNDVDPIDYRPDIREGMYRWYKDE